jgi:hypothetical protein
MLSLLGRNMLQPSVQPTVNLVAHEFYQGCRKHGGFPPQSGYKAHGQGGVSQGQQPSQGSWTWMFSIRLQTFTTCRFFFLVFFRTKRIAGIISCR